MKTVDIIIVNWNAGAMLRACLDSIETHGGDRVDKIIVVDNASSDGSEQHARRDGVTLIEAGANLGFGAACNLAASRSRADYLLLLNPDAELRSDAIDDVLKFMDDPQHADIGVAGVRLVDAAGVAHRHCARFPTWRTFLGGSLGLTRVAKRWFPPVLMSDFDHLSDRDVDHVMGAFYMIRRPLFEQLGGFDDDFFVYLEDLDLSRRVARQGFRIRYLSGVAVYHKQGGTSEQVKAHRLFYALSSNVVYASKHFGRGAAAAVTVVTFTLEPVSRLARAVLRRSPTEFGFTLGGVLRLYRAAPHVMRKVARNLRHPPILPSAGRPAADTLSRQN